MNKTEQHQIHGNTCQSNEQLESQTKRPDAGLAVLFHVSIGSRILILFLFFFEGRSVNMIANDR